MRRIVKIAIAFSVLSAILLGAGYWYVRSSSVAEIEATGTFDVATNDELPVGLWTAWRGKHGDGSDRLETREFAFETVDDATAYLEIPGRGHSTPVEVGDRLLFTTADEEDATQHVICVAKDCSEILWNVELHQGGFADIHEENSHASASIATDGERVYTSFLNANRIMVSCCSLEGDILWQKEAGPYFPEWGFGSTAIVYGGLVIVVGENKSDGVEQFRISGFICALNAQNGEIVWRIQRPVRSYGSPCLINADGRAQLVLASTEKVSGIDVMDGREIWRANWTAGRTANAVCPYKDSVIVSCGSLGAREVMRIRTNGTGDVTESHVVWKFKRNPSDVPSPAISGDLVLIVSDKGIATCLDGESGEKLWHLRLGGKFFSSPVVAGERAYVINRSGKAFSFLMTREQPAVTEGDIGAEVYASPVLLDDGMVIRTVDGLYFFEEMNRSEDTSLTLNLSI